MITFFFFGYKLNSHCTEKEFLLTCNCTCKTLVSPKPQIQTAAWTAYENSWAAKTTWD